MSVWFCSFCPANFPTYVELAAHWASAHPNGK